LLESMPLHRGGRDTNLLNQRLVIEGDLSVEAEPAADFFQKIDHLLGVDVEEVHMLIDRKS